MKLRQHSQPSAAPSDNTAWRNDFLATIGILNIVLRLESQLKELHGGPTQSMELYSF